MSKRSLDVSELYSPCISEYLTHFVVLGTKGTSNSTTRSKRHRLATHSSRVQFIKIDVDESPEVSQEFGVEAMPTFVLVKRVKEVDRVVGAKIDELEKKVAKHREAFHYLSMILL
ncbi:hypothetical protein K2173_020166 [Erythroxylum novogranatense]|uniref:Thioredoxin domain-containing protein n=1 Tax=Erythroxylum novogranatense TaxID=1862640 RepID=A0AAV8U761_9ROSI|nr:hypothetical protein K2173_020166 [Erythroxylum novogranatense]